ncbi:MAG: hypothetical protein GWM90_16615 [Gemmatimonadetes bacterium]|nr:hypothetical protein [Gemmatimonadota bacterium]NIQ55909.1 hypothetical protein [Gemmatimonadota bacterium]NIU79045.1 hypothetical protein [Gammaproteobacteria bacterium]NIX45659.1 hypothetical protein [Gemmatimonadota bacterium]NIY09960.1 hypothetical protein [Gemmatimonadota bacterium]
MPDSTRLLDSPLLPGSIYAEGEALLSEGELRDLGERLGALPPPPWELGSPRVTWPWEPGRGLVRYNRVEGLSAGARLDWDLTRLRTDLTARIGVADTEPRVELGVELPTLSHVWRLAGYRRLAAMDPSVRPLGPGNSLTALLLGRDDGTYFQATGAELRLGPAPGQGRYDLRLYVERQRAVERNTDASVAHLLDEAHRFRPNLPAAAADQVGVAARAGVERGLDPTGFRWGTWLDLRAETGDFTFARPGVTLRLAAPLPAELLGAVELAGGTTLHETGDPPPLQAAWFLGGPATLRGFPGGALYGPDYARARLELANQLPAARLALFSDAGWAGSTETYRREDVALSAGIGASVLDGLLRADLARAIQPEPGWRLELYIDAVF